MKRSVMQPYHNINTFQFLNLMFLLSQKMIQNFYTIIISSTQQKYFHCIIPFIISEIYFFEVAYVH